LPDLGSGQIERLLKIAGYLVARTPGENRDLALALEDVKKKNSLDDEIPF